MAIHEHNPNRKSDDHFRDGSFADLVAGYECRRMDGRRTPGYIEKVDLKTGMFTWKITGFEDEGRCWVLPFCEVYEFQFPLKTCSFDASKVQKLEAIDQSFDHPIIIESTKKRRVATEAKIDHICRNLDPWLSNNKSFKAIGPKVDIQDFDTLAVIAKVFESYMEHQGLLELEKKTAENLILNPKSGEWIKGMIIVLAELGLVSCRVGGIRTMDIFSGMGHKSQRIRYLCHRLAFVRVLFRTLDLGEVILYRGMASEYGWHNTKRSLLNMTFSKEVAQAFSSFDERRFKSSYLMRTVIEPEDLFMTYIETQQMNDRYREREAVVLLREALCL